VNAFPSDIQFRKPWRRYQQRVLSELKDHLDDNHLHIVAAPGSGKTVLGLEVVCRLNQPTLIFAPNIAIRDQWVERLIGMFSERGREVPNWISRDIRRPRFLTVSTYQGLHSVYTGQAEAKAAEEDEEEKRPHRAKDAEASSRFPGKGPLLKELKQLGIRTLVLDEAHHLRNEWWRCLIDVKKHLGNPTIVALTATAPFDVSPFEWDRYVDLCGPIDTEIAVPELVLEKNLCPHQDYVYVSAPLRAEREELRTFRKEVDEAIKALCANDAFVQTMENHPCVRQPKEHIEEILSDSGFYSSIAFFLNHVRGAAPRKLLRIIGFSPRRCPKLQRQWLETLLIGCLYSHAKSFAGQKDVLGQIGRDLKRIGAIERRTVNLRSTPRTARLLTRSVSKLKSIEEIVALESQSLGPDLRMVVLTDFIRRADFPKDPADLKPIKRLGVVPIFEQIRRRAKDDVRLGILTGTLTVVPSEAQEPLKAIAAHIGIDPNAIGFKPLTHDERFCEVTIRGADKQKIVTLITELFRQGGVTVLIGTTALLGEGWDAPSVNTLILASFVGSYMLSNQMRGRAIRTQEGNPSKTANIWHLLCQEEGVAEAGEDMETLARRFKAFVGVSFKNSAIESGLGRLGLGIRPGANRSDQRRDEPTRPRSRWTAHALGTGAGLGPRGIDAGGDYDVATGTAARFRFRADDPGGAVAGLVLGRFGFLHFDAFGRTLVGRDDLAGTDAVTGNRLGPGSGRSATEVLLAALPKFFKAMWLFLRHGPVASSMKQIGKALLKALVEAEAIETRPSRLRVIAQHRDYGFVTCTLKGGTTRERSVFLEALQELMSPVDNPRYLLVRKNPLGPLMRKDYHAVPKVLAKKKELAEYFRKMWARHVGPCDLVYTRNTEGRQLLLKARAQSMSAAFQHRTERTRAWR